MRDYDFERIRAHYIERRGAIMAAENCLGIDPYAWEHEAGIRLTPIEAALWHDIRAEGVIFYPQYQVGRYFVDFGNPRAHVAIECDSARWHTDPDRDAARQAEIELAGWTVYRIGGRDCLTDATETEDENGTPLLQAGAARLFIRDICARHAVRIG